MISHVSVRNFKALENVSLTIKPLTVLIGPNNSGKSSLIQSLVLLKQSISANQLQLAGPFFNFGGYREIVTDHVTNNGKNISMKVSGELNLPRKVRDILDLPESASYTYQLTLQSETDHELLCTVAAEPINVRITAKRGSTGNVDPSKITFRDGFGFTLSFQSIERPFYVTSTHQTLEGSKSDTVCIDEMREAIDMVGYALTSDIRRTFFVPANRWIDRPSLSQVDEEPQDLAYAASSSKQADYVASTNWSAVNQATNVSNQAVSMNNSELV